MENEEIIKVENNGGKGNPNHKPAGSPDGGQFTSSDEGSAQSAQNITAPVDDDSFGSFELKQEEPQQANSLKSAMMNFIGKKKEILSKEAKEYVDDIKSKFEEAGLSSVLDKFSQYDSLSREEKIDMLQKNQTAGYDPLRLKFATDEQLLALLYADSVKNMPDILEAEKTIISNKISEINNEIEEKLSQNNIDTFSGIWKNKDVHPSDYATLKEIGSFDKKVDFYNSVLNDSAVPLADKMKAKQYLGKLKEFEKLGQEYEKLKSEFMGEKIHELEVLEDKHATLFAQKHNFTEEDGKYHEFLLKADEYANKFKDINSAYSKYRKDNAVWFNEGSGYQNMLKALAFFGKKANQHWESMSAGEKSSLLDYTSSPSKFNEPLRKINYAGYKTFESGINFHSSKSKQFAKGINDMTSAIDRCTWDYDVWVQRGVYASTQMFIMNGKKRSIDSMTDAEMKSMVGTVFTDNGFYSAGAGKDTGFLKSLIINTYCPKGTKMAYMNTKGHYANSEENEMILQRGYTYRITKVERKGGQYYLDVEVILGSDENKPVGKDLEEIGEKYYA